MSFIGKTLKGYQIKEQIGEGGFGAVYIADQHVVDRTVVIKVIWPELAQNIDFIRRFESEAKIVASLEHPQIVPLYDFWRDPDGAYMVMRWLRGGNLRSRMNAKWSAERVVRLLNQLASAVTLAHRYGIIHRDIKPENILLDEDENAYLTDFGIAQIFGARRDEDVVSGMGSVVYAAPEQFDDNHSVSPQTDQYSLGLLIYELLAGEHPFKHLMALPHSQIKDERLSERLPPITLSRPDLPQELNAVLSRATSLNERERYPDAMAFARAFRDTLAFKATQRAEASLLNDDTLFRTPNGTIRTPDGSPYVERILEATPETLSNPYRGLRSFQESDSLYFFGRERITEHLINRLAETDLLYRFLAVVGPSGSGKSSLVKAGVMPALRDDAIPGSEKWFMLSMTPGTHPLEELEIALLQIATDNDLNIGEQLHRDERGLARVVKLLLRQEDGEILLYIDQFEELFTLVEDSTQTKFFLDTLHAALTAPHSRLRVIITLRADFYDRPLLYENFSHLIRERTEVVVPMTSEELNRAIISPAEMAGISFEQGLAPTIVSEVSGQLGALPLLQYGLTELFEQRERNVITLKTYHELGGILGALARRAEELYNALNPAEQEAARQVFIRLVTLGEGTEDTRRRVLLEEIYAAAADKDVTRRVIETFSNSRLLTFDYDPATRSPTLEVAHEAILREWMRLRTWLDESREDIRLQRNLATLAQEWDTADRDNSYLLRGVRLEQYEQWHQETAISLTEREDTYLRASVGARETRLAAEQAQEARQATLERRARMRLRFLLLFMSLAMLVALGLILLLQNENEQVQNARATSDANAILSDTLALVANARTALTQGNTDLALALAVAANERSRVPVEAQRLLAEVGLGPGTRWLATEHNSRISRVFMHDDGTQFITADADGLIIVWDRATQTPTHRLDVHTSDVRDVDVTADWSQIASSAENGEVILWDMDTATPLHRLEIEGDVFRTIAFTHDEQAVLVGGSSTQLILVDVAEGNVIDRFDSPIDDVFSIAAHDDGEHFLVAGGENDLVLWNMTEGEVTTTYRGHTGIVRRAIFNADYSAVLSGAEDNAVILWDTNSGDSQRVFQGHSRIVHDIAFGPNEQSIVSTSADSTLIVWNIETGSIIDRFRASESYAFSLAFVPEQMIVIAGYTDGAVRHWDLTSVEQRWVRFLTANRGLVRTAINPDGERALTSIGPSNLDDVILTRPELLEVDLETGEILRSFSGHALAISSMIFPDATRAYSSSFDGSIIFWDLETGEQIDRFSLGDGFLTDLALSADGTTIATGSFGEKVFLLDALTGDVIRTFEGHGRPVLTVAYHPNNEWLVSGDDRGNIRVWDITTGETIRTLDAHTGIVFGIDFTADGQRMLSASIDSQILLWDIETGEILQRLRGHAAGVTDITFSPNEQFILSGAEDGTLLLWSVETGTVLRSLRGHLNAVSGVAFADDGISALSVGLDGAMYRWQIPQDGSLVAPLDVIQQNRYVFQLNCEDQLRYRLVTDCR